MSPYISKYFLLISISIILFSACRKDNRPANLHADTNNLIFKKGETAKYFSIVNTGNKNMDFQISASDNYLNITPSSGVLGFNEMAKIQVTATTENLDFGIHKSSILVNSNGGVTDMLVQIYKPYPDPPVLWWDIDYIKIDRNSDRDYVMIRNDGEEILDYSLNSQQSWIGFSQNSGHLQSGEEDKIWIEIDRTGLSNDLYSGVVNINSNGGTGQISIDMEVGVYSVSFFNPTYTPMNIHVQSMGSQEIAVLDRVNYVYDENPQNIFYRATTHGETVGSQILGLTLIWQESLDLSGETSPIFDLNASEDFFFLSVINYGNHDLDQWSINYNTDYQFDENVLIPNDDQEYYFGYYDALNNSNVYARIFGTNNDAVWENGKEFNFSWTLNQSILLESSLKSTDKNSSRSYHSKPKQQALLQVKSQNQKILRKRNSYSLKSR